MKSALQKGLEKRFHTAVKIFAKAFLQISTGKDGAIPYGGIVPT